ncbi:Vacuolar protein sorting-associated protein 9a [Nosema granulosis]|uniref:Vacuolar protein sorting-associated protein 9a n=1 Tax=Nosema granulosis TaxID=83296 RepID=A0A9P6L035_9MICR|nr:Vacuolar protein sorting-associated protein 9a [Nosema granulosis]
MIDRYMETVESIYKSIGKDSEHSRFFSVFVLVLVKSQRDDLDHLLFFMEKFRRSPLDSCGSKCLKGHREDEVNYYLTVFKAGLEFIEKLEYYDLNISQEEFNQKIKHVDL